ncbi:hypothetical protein ACN2XU_02125 [Primorskyibacter sp. 2E107]|uniref:hypothetical protein n=1 Tax=Primorskyibacter sp. 2E107 TaxID=3403458 RepID=UPI003AF81387
MSRVEEITQEIERLQAELEVERTRRACDGCFRMKNGKPQFNAETRALHRRQKVTLAELRRRTPLRLLVTGPVIFSLIVPFAIIDLWVSLYMRLCFPLYGIPSVRRADYVRIDRHLLDYLNVFQKLYCVYCGYCNGVAAYVREVSSRTEAFWCPIKHASKVAGPHPRYATFLPYGDGKDYIARLDESRARVRAEK